MILLGALVDGVIESVDKVYEDNSLEQIKYVRSPNAEVLQIFEEDSGHQEPKDEGHDADC